MPAHWQARMARLPRGLSAALLALALCLAATANGAAAESPAVANTPPGPTSVQSTAPPPPDAAPAAATSPASAEGTAGLPTASPAPAEGSGNSMPPSPAPAENATNPPPATDAEICAAFEQRLQATLRRFHTMGAVVCVLQNGRVTDTFTYGVRDRKGTPMTQDTLFRVGSISKLVTAVGVMQLWEQGRVMLDSDVSAYLGAAVRNAAYPDTPITLRQLMTHTAGLRDGAFYNAALAGRVKPLAEVFAPDYATYAFLPKTRPGSAMQYSNFGGGLLGSVVEGATGATVDAYLRETLFAPLGITAAFQSALLPETAAVTDQYHMPGRKRPTAVRDGTPANAAADPATHYTLTAGKLTLSAPDLAKVLIALCDGGVYGAVRILQPKTALLMRTAQNNLGSVHCESGRGLCVSILRGVVPGRTLYGHGGKAGGMLCAAFFDPTDRTGVVMLTNGCDARAAGQEIGKLSSEVLQLAYSQLIDMRAVLHDPWLVVD